MIKIKYIFLLNSFTLKNKLNIVINNIEKYCSIKNIEYKIEINNKDNSTETILNRYKKSNNIIIAVGGDGILNRTLNQIVNTNNILGLIPLGTGNDFYKTALEEFKNGINECNLVKINNKYFINIACFGIDADVANNKKFIKSKIIPKKQKYNVSLINTFIKFKSRRLTVKINNNKYINDYDTIVICNGKYYGGGYKVGVTSNPSDNILETYLVKSKGKLNLLKLLLKIKSSKHENSNQVLKVKTNKIQIISTEKFECNIDGESLYDNKFNIELCKNNIKFYFDKEMIDIIKKNL